jgi:Rrf2 family protein
MAPSSSRFQVAVHVAAFLAVRRQEGWLSSECIAASVVTHPVVIRRILGSLAKAGLIETVSGKKGGARLTRDAAKIRLIEIYQAVEPRAPISRRAKKGKDTCIVACRIGGLLAPVLDRAERAFEKALAETSLKELIREMQGA